jgi:hypothetical protein
MSGDREVNPLRVLIISQMMRISAKFGTSEHELSMVSEKPLGKSAREKA